MSVVTISRQFGAGGRTLGQMVAKELGYTFIDNEIIQMVAQKAKVSKTWVESIEKEAGGAFQKFITGVISKGFMDRLLDDKRGYIDEEVYVDMLHKIISKIADEGNVVILGRGSQYILQGRPNVYHVLLVAAKEDRIKFMEDRYSLTRKQAAKAVEADDKRRVNLYQKFGKSDYENPLLYHLVFNMSQLTLELACRMVTRLVKK